MTVDHAAAAALRRGAFRGVFSLLPIFGLAVLSGCRDATTFPVADPPAQFVSLRRAFLPGERDSTAAWVVRTRAWDEFSDLAPLAYAAWDSTTDVIVNPLWHPPVASAPIQRAPQASQFQAGWGAVGMNTLVVFDSIPKNAATRDSLDWVSVRWWNPADSTWKGFVINATTQTVFGKQNIITTVFNSSGGHSGLGGGEARLASGTYWEANGGTYKVSLNGNFGAFQQITSGPYLGGDIRFGNQAGQLTNLTMPRLLGTDTPTTETFSFNYSTTPLNAQDVRCYFAPITPPTGFHQCTGAAFAAIVAAARAGRLSARTAAGFADTLEAILAAPPPARRRSVAGRRPRHRARPR